MRSSRAASNREEWLRSTRREFAERYFRWSLEDARREVEGDFPFLPRVRNQLVYRFLEMIEPMDKKERFELITALAKRSHPAGPVAASEVLTEKDQNLIAAYLEYDHGEVIPGVRARLPIIRDGKHKRMRVEGEGFKLAKIDRRALHRAISERLKNACGPKQGDYGSRSSSYFEKPVGFWIARTEFRTNSKFWHFDYSHCIMTSGGLIVAQGVTLLHWLGLGGGQTLWELEDESQVADAVEALGEICEHFLRAVGPLLRGLDPPTRIS